MATAYLHKYGATQEQLAAIAVKNHANGAKNPKAHFQKAITLDQVMDSRMIAWPLKLYDCCPFSDGAAAAVVTTEERAKELGVEYVKVLGSGRAGMTASLHDREDLTRMDSARIAAEHAYKQAGLGPKDIDVAEVHDCFTIAEILAVEDLGFAAKGEGGPFTENGGSDMGGTVPVNASGGLKAKGHPLGATGIGQVHELFRQLRGEADPGRQVDGAEVALAHNVGGSGASCAVHLLGV